MSAKRALRRFRAPDELAAEERAWATVRAAYETREYVPRARRGTLRVLVFVATLALAALALSPAGATVGRLITRALGVQHASPTLSSLPASGRLLVSGPGGTWTIAADGSTRRLGPWRQASWSPRGLYVVASDGHSVGAVNPRGATQWMLARPAVSAASWFSPSGYRVAYLSAGDLRVVAGDGTGDHLLARAVARVAPAWRPEHAYQLAYLTERGMLVVRDADSGRLIWSRPLGATTRSLQWSGSGAYLLAASSTIARLYRASGAAVSQVHAPAGSSLIDAALAPDGRTLALVLGGAVNEVELEDVLAPKTGPRRVLAGPGLRQVLWSPDGRWLLVGWPAANQLVFVGTTGSLRVAAVSHIAQQFSSGGRASGFPQLDGWCCQAR
jgi:hypothetical protein